MEKKQKRNGSGVLCELLRHEESFVELRTTSLYDIVGFRGRIDSELMDDSRNGIGNEDFPKRKTLQMSEKQIENVPVMIEKVLENELLDERVSKLEADL